MHLGVVVAFLGRDGGFGLDLDGCADSQNGEKSKRAFDQHLDECSREVVPWRRGEGGMSMLIEAAEKRHLQLEQYA